jgi:hypothetical protein
MIGIISLELGIGDTVGGVNAGITGFYNATALREAIFPRLTPLLGLIRLISRFKRGFASQVVFLTGCRGDFGDFRHGFWLLQRQLIP